MPDFRPDLHPRDREGRWRPVDIAHVRRTLRAAGLVPAKADVSTNVRKTHGMGGSYRTIRQPGFALRNETEYRQKRHHPTGRVEVEHLQSSWHPDAALAAEHERTATGALEAAGYEVRKADAPNKLIVSRRVTAQSPGRPRPSGRREIRPEFRSKQWSKTVSAPQRVGEVSGRWENEHGYSIERHHPRGAPLGAQSTTRTAKTVYRVLKPDGRSADSSGTLEGAKRAADARRQFDLRVDPYTGEALPPREAQSPGRPRSSGREQGDGRARQFVADLAAAEAGKHMSDAEFSVKTRWLEQNGYMGPDRGLDSGGWRGRLNERGRALLDPPEARSPGRPGAARAAANTAQSPGRPLGAGGFSGQGVAGSGPGGMPTREDMARATGRSVPEPDGGISLRYNAGVSGPFATWDQAAQALAVAHREGMTDVEARAHSAHDASHRPLDAAEQAELVRRTARLLAPRAVREALDLEEAWTDEARKAALEARRRGGHAAVVDLVRRGDQPAQRVAHAISARDARGLLDHLQKNEDPGDPHVRALKKSLRARLAPKPEPVPDMQTYLGDVIAQMRARRATA